MDESPRARWRPDAPTLLTLLLVGVVVTMGAVASARGWIPTGDDAFLSLRTRHVFSAHPILLNNASSAGPSAGSQYNHPGAFPLTLLTPVTLVGGPGSLALATALVNAAWIALVSVMVRRIAGAGAQLGALLAAALLVWSMGSTLLVDPWNPNFGIWPVAALVVAAWGTRRGHTSMLAVAVLAASVAFQTHLSLTVLSVAVAAWALVGAGTDWFRADLVDRRRVVLRVGAAAMVGLVANAQMLADQFRRSGNLSKILDGTGFEEATVSVRQVTAVVVSKMAIPPTWFRGSWAGPILPSEEPSTAAIGMALVVVVALTVGALWCSRWRLPAITSLLGVLGVAAASATLVSTRFPLRVGIPLPYFRWVWPLAAIWLAAVVPALTSRLAPAVTSRLVDRSRMAGAVLVVVVGLAAFIPTNEDVSPNPEWAQDISRSFGAAAVRETADKDVVVIDQSIQEAALWVVPALMDQLDAAGIGVRANDPVLVQQTADTFAAGGGERWHLAVRGGLQIDDAPPNARRIAVSRPLTESQEREYGNLVEELVPALAVPDAIRLTASGRDATDAADLEHLTTGELPPEELLQSVPFHLAFERGAVEVDGVDRTDLRRALELGALVGGRSIALYLYEVR